MGRRLVTPLLLFMLTLGSLAATSVAAAAAAYQDPKGAYGFTVPDGWQANPPTDTLSLSDTVNGATFVIGAQPANGMSLDAAFQQAAALYSTDPTFDAGPGGVTDLTVGGQPAKAMSFQNNAKGGPLLLSTGVITVINKDTVYVMYFVTTSDKAKASDPGLMTILTSWQFM